MSWQAIALLAAVAAPFAAVLAQPAFASEPPRVSGPVVHDNLAVFFIHGPSVPGPVPLTLKEALAAGKVTVHETGSVSTLSIENTGEEEVFVQAGDIVKGGQQDRVLTVSFLVPPRSGRMPIGAFCVEQGRWSARGQEDVKRFASADKAVPSREAKLAMFATPPPRPEAPTLAPAPTPAPATAVGPPPSVAPPSAAPAPSATLPSPAPAAPSVAQRTVRQSIEGGAATGYGQSGVWASVARAQSKLSANVGASVTSATSATSLQLALESRKLEEARRAYIDKLRSAGESGDDIIGYVIVVGGRINSGDVYPSNGLFRKMWSKQLEAAATEAIAELGAPAPATPPAAEDVRAFIARAESGRTTLAKVDGATYVRETRDTDTALFLETRKAGGGFVHRSYLAR